MNYQEILDLLKTTGLAAIVKGLINTAIETHIKPRLENLYKNKDDAVDIEEHIREYLKMSYEKHITMNTIVFRGEQKNIYELYIPLTLTCNNFHNKKIGEAEYFIEDDCFKAVDEFGKIMIVDTAGMGKSTLAKYLAVQSINQNRFIPIIVELRKLDKSSSIIKYICKQMELIDKNINESNLRKMIKMGGFIFIFDGYDEISEENKEKVTNHIQEFIAKVSNNKFILTSREESELGGFGDFKTLRIKPLEVEEAFNLIKKYDNNGEMSKKLVKHIQKDEQMEVLREFLTNPLLVSLLYKTFCYKQELAYKKIAFYDQVYVALFNDHDKTKGGAYVHPKKSKLDHYDFERVLRGIGFLSLKADKIAFDRNELYNMILKVIKRNSWMETTPSDFIQDLTYTVPLFCKDGNDYKWVHKSFMEYFAAGFICIENKKNSEEIISSMINSQNNYKYLNVLDFCFELRPDIARYLIIYEFISNYINYYEEMKCLQNCSSQIRDLIASRLFINDGIISCTYDKDFTEFCKDNNLFTNVQNAYSFFSTESPLIIVGFSVNKNAAIECFLRARSVDIFQRVSVKHKGVIYNTNSLCKQLVVNEILNMRDLDFDSIDDDVLKYIFQYIIKTEKIEAYLDYSKCKKMKEEIDKEKEDRNDDVFVL